MSCGSWSFGGWNYWNGICWHWNYEVVGMGVAEVGGIGMGIVGADLSERELREFYGCSSNIFAGEGSLQGIRLWEYSSGMQFRSCS